MKRSCGLLVFEVEMCNPNGDIDSDNRPRCLSTGIGWISDVCIKAKIRELLADHDSPVFKELQATFGFDPDRFHILESADRGFASGDVIASKNAALKLANDAPIC